MNQHLVWSIGLFAQILFSARLLTQWISSEKAHKVMSPTIFWQLSMVASFIFCIYGWLRNDFAIILGQFISYYIYIRNLQMKHSWKKLHAVARGFFIIVPAFLMGHLLWDFEHTVSHLFRQSDIPLWLVVFGVIGQCTFTLRFIYQWRCSRRAGESILPMGFWTISLTGAAMIIIYAIIRHDVVLIIGQVSGLVVYIRNIVIAAKERG